MRNSKNMITKGAVTPESNNNISNSSKNFGSKNIVTKGGITPNPLDKMFSNDEGYEIEIKEENNELFFDVVEEETNKRFVSKIHLPEGITISDLFDSLEKHFYQIINEEDNIEIAMIFNKDGSPMQENYMLKETSPTPGQEILKDENSIFSNLYQDKYLNKNNANENSLKKSNFDKINNQSINNNNNNSKNKFNNNLMLENNNNNNFNNNFLENNNNNNINNYPFENNNNNNINNNFLENNNNNNFNNNILENNNYNNFNNNILENNNNNNFNNNFLENNNNNNFNNNFLENNNNNNFNNNFLENNNNNNFNNNFLENNNNNIFNNSNFNKNNNNNTLNNKSIMKKSIKNKEITPSGTPSDSTQDIIGALFNLKILDDPYVNQYHRTYIISKELNQLIKINLKNTPSLFVTKHEMEIDIQKNKENSKYFIISLLQDLLEKAGIKTVVERKCEQPELASDLLQMIVSGIGLLPVYEFHTDYGDRENYNILTNENVQKNFVESWKKKLAKSLKIDPKVIFICDFRNGSLKFNVFLGKQLNDEEINRLKNEYSNEFINEGINFGEFLLQSCKLSLEMFEPQYNNYDRWAPKGEKRGGEPYDSPLTWRGFGLKVLGKYDNGNNTWIGMQNKPGEFPVAYHGIGCNSNNPFPIAGRIVNEGFMIGKRQFYFDSPDIRHPGRKCGFGAYFTPNIEEAGSYAGTGNFNGKNYKIVFMCRVRKENIREPNRNNQPKYWILDGTKNEVRPYRILIKEQ